jgi:hypothetical protein
MIQHAMRAQIAVSVTGPAVERSFRPQPQQVPK